MVIVAIRLPNQQSNNFHEEQQQNAKWSGLARYVCSFPAFSVGSPSKVAHYMCAGLRGQCPQAGLWLLVCHITNIILIFGVDGGKIWAWKLWYWRPSRRWAWLILRVLGSGIFLLIAVWIHYDFSYLIWRQQASPRTLAFHCWKLLCIYWMEHQTLSWQSSWGKCPCPLPNSNNNNNNNNNLTTVTQLPITKIT